MYRWQIFWQGCFFCQLLWQTSNLPHFLFCKAAEERRLSLKFQTPKLSKFVPSELDDRSLDTGFDCVCVISFIRAMKAQASVWMTQCGVCDLKEVKGSYSVREAARLSHTNPTRNQPLPPPHHANPILQRESRRSIRAAVCSPLISVTVEPGQRFITALVSHSVCLICTQVCSLRALTQP